MLRLMEHAAKINATGTLWCEQRSDLMVWGVCLKSVLHPGKHMHYENASPDMVVDEAIEDTLDWGSPASFWEINTGIVDCVEEDVEGEKLRNGQPGRVKVKRRPNLMPMHPLTLENSYAMHYLN